MGEGYYKGKEFYCSECDHRISGVEIKQARFDYCCPRCGNSYQFFYPVKEEEEE